MHILVGVIIAFLILRDYLPQIISGALILAAMAMGFTILKNAGVFDSNEERIERLKKKAKEKDYRYSTSTIISSLGKDGRYADSQFLIEQHRTESSLGSKTTTEIRFNGSTVYSGEDYYVTHSTDRYGRRYELDSDDTVFKHEIISYIPGSWEQTYRDIASRAKQLSNQSLTQWKQKSEDEERKRFGL